MGEPALVDESGGAGNEITAGVAALGAGQWLHFAQLKFLPLKKHIQRCLPFKDKCGHMLGLSGIVSMTLFGICILMAASSSSRSR